MAKGIFITGTDTGVGKTVIAAGIIRAIKRKGINAGAMKPVETGCKIGQGEQHEEELITADAMFLRKVAGMHEPVDIVCPCRFLQPLAPMAASEIEGKPFDMDAVINAYGTLKSNYEFLVVEGAGGLMAPLDSSPFFVADLIRALDLSAIVVTRAGLGTINHTLLTVLHALREKIKVAGVIINHSEPPLNTIAEQTNPDVLKRLCPVPVLGPVPWIDPPLSDAAVDAVADSLGEWIERTAGLLT